MIEISGHSLSKGYGIGTLYRIENNRVRDQALFQGEALETKRLQDATLNVQKDLEELIENLKKKSLAEEAEIFESHLLILEDPDFLEKIRSQLTEASVENALQNTVDYFEKEFLGIDDEYIRQRITDLKDIQNRILGALADEVNAFQKYSKELEQPESRIYYSKELTPSQTASLRGAMGFLTAQGGATSHAAILARALGVPAVSGVNELELQDGSCVCVDGFDGKIYLNPSDDFLVAFKEKIKEFEIQKEDLQSYSSKKSISASGVLFHLEANIGGLQDLSSVLDSGADGIGLFRTEFLFMNRQIPPSEEEQFQIYSELFQKFQRPIKIRTFDVGGDKKIPYFMTEPEENPFLGVRGVRLYFNYPEIFKSQLRAILRASVLHSNIGVMIPMVSTAEEVFKIFTVFKQCQKELLSQGIGFSDRVQFGIMVEVPSILYALKNLVDVIDFVSIGTNDLSQYLFAADRGLKSLNAYHDAQLPEFVCFMRQVSQMCKENDLPCSICGDAGSRQELLTQWMNLGIHRLSMPALEILAFRKALASI